MPINEHEESPLGRSFKELTTPRPFGMPSPDVFDSHLAQIEAQMRQCIPIEVRKRVNVIRNLLVYGGFSYDLITVAAFWSFTCVEMALWHKFIELHPGPLTVHRKREEMQLHAAQLSGNLRLRWRLPELPKFNGSFRSLADWAIDEGLVPAAGPLDAIINLRNSFAHPNRSNDVLSPGMVVPVFQKVVEIVNHLWPLELPPTGATLISRIR